MPQRFQPAVPVGAAKGDSRVDQQAMQTMASIYGDQLRAATAASQGNADRALRGSLAQAQMNQEMTERAMAIGAQQNMQEQELAARQQMQQEEFRQRMELRQMELSMTDQMTMRQQQNGIAAVQKQMSEGRLERGDGQQLIDLMSQGLNALQARQVMHQLKQEEIASAKAMQVIEGEREVRRANAELASKTFNQRIAASVDPEVRFDIEQEMGAQLQMLRPEGREMAIFAEARKRGGIIKMYQETADLPNAPAKWVPYGQASGADKQLAHQEFALKQQDMEFNRVRDDWYRADEAVKKSLNDDILMKRKMNEPKEGNGPNGEVAVPKDAPALSNFENPHEFEKARAALMEQRYGFKPNWPEHLAMIKQNMAAAKPRGQMGQVDPVQPQQQPPQPSQLGEYPGSTPGSLGAPQAPAPGQPAISRADAPVEPPKMVPPQTVATLRQKVQKLESMFPTREVDVKGNFGWDGEERTREAILPQGFQRIKELLKKPELTEEELQEITQALLALKSKPPVSRETYVDPREQFNR